MSNDVELLSRSDNGRAAYLVRAEYPDPMYRPGYVILCDVPQKDFQNLIGQDVVAQLENGSIVVRTLRYYHGGKNCDLFSYYKAPLLDQKVEGLSAIAGHLVQTKGYLARVEDWLSRPWKDAHSEEAPAEAPKARGRRKVAETA